MSDESKNPTDNACCEEFERAAQVTRRRFMQTVAAGAGMSVAATSFGGVFRQAAFGAQRDNNVVVVISLRGGIDGLSVVVPYKENNYYSSRPGIGIPEGSLICKDTKFGLHPALQPMEKFWTANRFAAVHAVGLKVPDRSHFSAMEAIEDAHPGSKERRGWINRAIGLDDDASPTEAVQFGTSIIPTALTGPAATIATENIAGLSLAAANPQWDSAEWRGRRRRQLNTIWDDERGPLGRAARSALNTVATMAPYARQTYTSPTGVTYPNEWPSSDLSDALQNSAQLIRANVGTEVIAIDYGSWDMHTDVGRVDGGNLQRMLNGFAKCVAAFLDDLADMADKVTVVTISEFGRRVDENGGGGLDHGWGNMMLLAGAGVQGGKYYGKWPGLAPSELGEGDLKVTTDYRNVLGEVVRHRLDRSVAKSFPGLSYKPLGMVTS